MHHISQIAGLAVLAAAVLWAVWTYNRLVRAGRLVDEAWSGIEVQLKRRHDLVPNLVETVKGYAAHEKSTLEELTALRGKALGLPSAPTKETVQIEGALGGALQRVLVLAENYPDLKAGTNFIALQHSLGIVEDDLQMARRYYNGTVREYTILRESVPSNVVSRLAGFAPKPFFELGGKAEARPADIFFS